MCGGCVGGNGVFCVRLRVAGERGGGGALVLLNGSSEPLLAVLGEIVMGQKWDCEWNIWLGRRKVAVEQGFVDDV